MTDARRPARLELDQVGRVELADETIEDLLGYERGGLVGQQVSELLESAARDIAEHRRTEIELRRSEARLSEAQQLARLGSWEWDITANAVTWSDELYRIYGLEPQELSPTYEEFLERVHPDDRAAVDARNHTCFADHQPFEDVKRVLRTDGSVFLMRTQGEMICDEGGNALRMVGICEDVTAQVRAQEAESMLAMIVSSSNDAIYAVSRGGVIASWNPAAARMFGYTESQAIGSSASKLLPPESAATYERLMRAALGGQMVEPFEATLLRGDGEPLEVSMSLSAMHSARDTIDSVSVIARDNTERKRLERQLRQLAEHDGLTGLYNRHRFDEELARTVANAARFGESAALLLLDIDDFKYVNDMLGHGAGDELLRSITAMVRGRLRSTDILARIGGDEFALLLPRAGVAEAQRVAAELVQLTRDHELMICGNAIRTTVSIGAVAFNGAGVSADEVLIAVDRAMYEAKEQGRDRYVICDDVKAVARQAEMPWEQRIREALEYDGFELHAQPILSLADRTISHYELLLRLREPDGTLAYPGGFLGVAERLGLIHAIDRWVVGEAIKLVAAHPKLSFAVNISGASMDDDDLLAAVRAGLKTPGADPSRLIFEITETATIARMDDARRFSEGLTGMGCDLAIDDFGTGFGSFFYLKHLPVSYLKIDGDFIAGPRSRTDELVIEAIVGMARGLGKRTIAEFVGDHATTVLLSTLGVDYAQGYHIGHPFPVADLAAA